MKKQVCAITMVRDDIFFLKKWISHYSRQIGIENLYVLIHGNNLEAKTISKDTNIIYIPAFNKSTTYTPGFDHDRIYFMNNLANGLLRYFQYVIVVDVDEYLIVDPVRGQSIYEYLMSYKNKNKFTPMGLNVISRRSLDKIIDLNSPILTQRSNCQFSALNSKPVITRKVIRRSEGNHASDDYQLFIAPDIYLFHLKFMDFDFTMQIEKNRHFLRDNLNDIHKIEYKDVPSYDMICRRFSYFENLTEANISFDFQKEKKLMVFSWRKRIYFLKKDFWLSLINGSVKEYSRHYRFDLINFDEYHQIPTRFLSII